MPLGGDRSSWFDRISHIGDPSPVSGSGLPDATQSASLIGSGQSISMLSISTSVSQMLSSIGGGVQNNAMLEMMIALLVILSMLDQQRAGNAGMNAMGGLGAGMSSSNISFSSTTISTQYNAFEYTQLTVNQIAVGNKSVGGASAPRFDTTI